MSIPGPINPPSTPVPQTLGGNRLTALIVGVLLVSLVLWSACAGLVYLASPGVRSSLQQANAKLPGAAQADPNDWWTARVLSEVYTDALDAAVSHEGVIQRLGEPVEINLEAEDLYRRQKTGPLGQAGIETIEFDLQGPKGKATVSVLSRGAPQRGEMLQIERIEATFDDGTSIEIPPPPAAPFQPR